MLSFVEIIYFSCVFSFIHSKYKLILAFFMSLKISKNILNKKNFLWFNVIYVIGIYFLPFFNLLHNFYLSLYNCLRCTISFAPNLLRWVGSARIWWALYWTEPASLQEFFILMTTQTPQEGICWPKKVTRSAKFAGWLGCVDLYFFESPDLSWKNSFKRGMNLKIIFFTTIWISLEV